MPATKTKTARNDSKSGAKSKPTDAIALLTQDHREVAKYFEDYEKLENDREKAALAEKICLALEVHMAIEEELFYPAARRETGDDDLLDEAAVEHQEVKQLVAEIEAMKVGDELYDAKVKVVGENVAHHVEEEETKLFPMTRKTDLDLDEIGRKLAQRKAELMAEPASARRR